MTGDVIMSNLLAEPLSAVFEAYPPAREYFNTINLPCLDAQKNILQYAESLPQQYLDDTGMTKKEIAEHFCAFVTRIEAVKSDSLSGFQSLTLLGGRDKSGQSENVSLVMRPGDILCIVGPTGSGKSRLLADIECMAQKDTPTGRQVLINGAPPQEGARFTMENKLVAQLSQNMNFVMDLSVAEFIELHAQSRFLQNTEKANRQVLACANELAGEPFSGETALTQLSGGQSRALMIAGAAMLSKSPVVLIDEIENAGIDRKKALSLLVKKEKIVLMATHDPILALLGSRRVVIKNGGIAAILDTGSAERENLRYLEKIDASMTALRTCIRNGERIDSDLRKLFSFQSDTSAN